MLLRRLVGLPHIANPSFRTASLHPVIATPAASAAVAYGDAPTWVSRHIPGLQGKLIVTPLASLVGGVDDGSRCWRGNAAARLGSPWKI